MIRLALFVLILATLGVAARTWLMRQGIAGRAFVSLGLLSIAMYLYGYALWGACHGEANFLTNPFACTHAHTVAFNPDAYRVGRAR